MTTMSAISLDLSEREYAHTVRSYKAFLVSFADYFLAFGVVLVDNRNQILLPPLSDDRIRGRNCSGSGGFNGHGRAIVGQS
jgi:hypothetical protein